MRPLAARPAMPNRLHRLLISLACLALAAAPAAARQDGTIATFEDDEGPISLERDAFVRFLIDTRGLDALLNMMQLELAKEQARRAGVEVTPADVQAEAQRTLAEAFVDNADMTDAERESALEQLLARQQLSRAEFDLIIETNATLRALAGPIVREALTDEMVRDAFNVRYGEQARVRVIGRRARADFAEIEEQLAAGESFEALARRMNVEPDLAANGGELPPFTQRSNYPDTFKQVVFALKPGEVGDTIVQAGELYYKIQLQEFIAPKAVKFEDVRDGLADDLVSEQVQRSLPQMRRRLASALSSKSLKIDDPELAAQLDARLAALQPQPTTPEELREEAMRGASTQPASK